MAAVSDRGKTAFPQLNAKNYGTWKIQCKMALMKEGLWSIVDGTELRPLDERRLTNYIERRNKALATIVLGVETSLLYMLGDPEDPELVWKKLASQFQKKSWANKNTLRGKLHDMKLTKGEEIQPHIKSMIETFDELAVIGYPLEEEDKVSYLLTSMPASFDMLRTALEASPEIPTMEVVTEKLIQEDRKIKEKQKNGESKRSSSMDGNAKAFIGKHKGKRNSIKCYNCGRYGHCARDCKEKSEEKEIRGNNNKYRHFSQDKRPKERKQQAHFSEHQYREQQLSSSDSDDDTVHSGFVAVNKALASTPSGLKKKTWLVDSGSSKHMCNNKKSFTSLRKLKRPEMVEVGDGHIVMTEYEGTVIRKMRIDGKVRPRKVKLNNVLYVPDLKYNLVSVSKATIGDKTVVFNNKGCKVKDENEKVIATARKFGDLYYLNHEEDEEATSDSETIYVDSDNDSETECAAAIITKTEKDTNFKKLKIDEVESDDIDTKTRRKFRKEMKWRDGNFFEVMDLTVESGSRNQHKPKFKIDEVDKEHKEKEEIQPKVNKTIPIKIYPDTETALLTVRTENQEEEKQNSLIKILKEPSNGVLENQGNENERHQNKTERKVTKKLDIEEITSEKLWHSRYGHLGKENLKKLIKDDLVIGLKNYNPKADYDLCKPCIDGKHHRFKFPKDGGKRASKVLELVHTDVCGKIDTKSLSGSEYFMTLIDDKSRYIWCYTLKFKSEVFQKFIEWKVMAEKSSERSLKTLRSDNGGEYISTEFEDYLKDKGIIHQTTVRKTPEQNGVAERMNRTLVEAIRSMLSESGLPKTFWAEALMTATYLRNRSPTTALTGMTPYEAWTGWKPSVNHLRIFGCICYAHIPKDERKKLDSKAKESIMLGYGTETKGYRLYDTTSKKINYSRDVIFNEKKFVKENKENEDILQVVNEDIEKEIEAEETSWIEIENSEITQNQDEDQEQKELELQQPIMRNRRVRNPPNFYGEWVNVAKIEEIDPKNVNQAMSSQNAKEWKQAMENEINSLKKNKVWSLVKLPEGKKAIGSKWIFKQKRDADGNVERFKARLVAQGYNQIYGVDYDETFSPVVRFESIRAVIALAARHNVELQQMDVKTAFLNGELQETIYMKQPDGFVKKGEEELVCLLHRSIYGLKQSARCWNFELDKQMKSLGFTQSDTDPCIYVQTVKNQKFIVAIYVDDIILGGENEKIVKCMKVALSNKFDIEDMGMLHHFLGVKIIQKLECGEIWIGQQTYAQDLLVRFKMDSCRPVDTPFDAGSKLKKTEDGEITCDRAKYQSAVGSLLYLSTKTRPDIAYAVGVVSRFCSNPSNSHWVAVKRILRYLQGTVNVGLLYSARCESTVTGYSDADWAGDVVDRISTTGYVFLMSGGAVSWRSKKQSCVALSTAEAEYMALACTFQEAIWMRKLLRSLSFDYENASNPTVVYEDNQSAICMSKNQQCHGQSKHIDIKYHFVREKVSEGQIELRYCTTENMLADMFTKGLSGPKFKKLCKMIGMVEVSI